MHASIWKFDGDPDELLRRYDAMLEEIPRARMRLHICLHAADGSLSLLGSTSLGSSSVGAEDARLGPNGQTLWVVDTGARAISAFAVDAGNLTQLPSSPTPLPSGSAPFGIVVT